MGRVLRMKYVVCKFCTNFDNRTWYEDIKSHGFSDDEGYAILVDATRYHKPCDFSKWNKNKNYWTWTFNLDKAYVFNDKSQADAFIKRASKEINAGFYVRELEEDGTLKINEDIASSINIIKKIDIHKKLDADELQTVRNGLKSVSYVNKMLDLDNYNEYAL